MTNSKLINWLLISVLFVLVPLGFYVLGDFPRRALFKELIAVVVVLSFFLIIAVSYVRPSNKSLITYVGSKPRLIMKLHKVCGYIFSIIILLHPFLIVLPRYFEAGVSPVDGLITIITTFHIGNIVGFVAWSLLFLLIITSFLRSHLSMAHRLWLKIHKLLAVAMLVFGSWHAIELGRHFNIFVGLYTTILISICILLIVKKIKA